MEEATTVVVIGAGPAGLRTLAIAISGDAFIRLPGSRSDV